jgi:hypothetical protein
MKTKTLALALALAAVGVASASAQTVYSVNAVGYVNKTVAAGKFALLANPLNLPTNSVAMVLPDVPNNTKIFKFSPTTGFTPYTKRATGWAPSVDGVMLPPGEGFFIKNAGTTDMTVTFVGEVLTGAQSISFGAGYSLLGSKIPQSGKVETDLGLPAQNGDKVFTFDGASYAPFTRRVGTAPTWPAGEPTIGVGDGFYYSAKAAGTWARTFTIPQ